MIYLMILSGVDLPGGWGGSSPPYSWCINGNMGRVKEKKRWRKEEKWRERKKKRPTPFNHVLHPSLDTIIIYI